MELIKWDWRSENCDVFNSPLRSIRPDCVSQRCLLGVLNISRRSHIHARGSTDISSWRECSKKSVQQGRSQFDARSVQRVREHGKMARTPLAAFFNIPLLSLTMSRGVPLHQKRGESRITRRRMGQEEGGSQSPCSGRDIPLDE